MVITLELTPNQYEASKWAIKRLDNAYSLELRKTVLKIHTDFNSWSLTAAKFYELLVDHFPDVNDEALRELDLLLVDLELALEEYDYGIFFEGGGHVIYHLDDVLFL